MEVQVALVILYADLNVLLLELQLKKRKIVKKFQHQFYQAFFHSRNWKWMYHLLLVHCKYLQEDQTSYIMCAMMF